MLATKYRRLRTSIFRRGIAASPLFARLVRRFRDVRLPTDRFRNPGRLDRPIRRRSNWVALPNTIAGGKKNATSTSKIRNTSATT